MLFDEIPADYNLTEFLVRNKTKLFILKQSIKNYKNYSDVCLVVEKL